jgi:hypothetical protein
LRDITFFKEPRQAFVIWADEEVLKSFVDKLKASGHSPGNPWAFGEGNAKGEAVYVVECPGISPDLAAGIIEGFPDLLKRPPQVAL